jgi:hypothetical protein
MFIFKRCPQAADYNAAVLEKFDFDLDKVIRHQHPSQISYGSEFRPPEVLETILAEHPLWPRFKAILSDGAHFPLHPMSDEDRSRDLSFHQDRGNHKSLLKYGEYIDPIITEDIERGFALPLPPDILPRLGITSIAPLGCHKQTTLNASVDIVPKYRLTHDQSFPGPSGLSVNLRVQKDKLPPIMYSFVLSRLLHYIVNIRHLLPQTKIFTCKFDIDAAYRRCSMSCATSLESLTIVGNLLLVALRLTFGGSPCPNLWGVISESMTVIANSLIQNGYWDHTSLYNQLSDSIEVPLALGDDVPFHPAQELSVKIPDNLRGYADIYIDDIIGVTPDLEDNTGCLSRAIPLAIHSAARPVDDSDILPRKDIIYMKKFQAEGRLEEVKKVLGWTMNTRSLTLSLPPDKHRDWTRDIRKMISAKKSHFKLLESLIGRLNHVACIFSTNAALHGQTISSATAGFIV